MSQKHTYELDYFPIPKGRAERFVAFLFLWLPGSRDPPVQSAPDARGCQCQVDRRAIHAGAAWQTQSALCFFLTRRADQFGEYKQAGNVLPWGHFPLLRVDGGLEKGGHNLSNSIALQWYVCAEEAPELIPKVGARRARGRIPSLTPLLPQAPVDQHWALSVALTTEDRFVTFVKFAFAPTDAKVSVRDAVDSPVALTFFAGRDQEGRNGPDGAARGGPGAAAGRQAVLWHDAVLCGPHRVGLD